VLSHSVTTQATAQERPRARPAPAARDGKAGDELGLLNTEDRVDGAMGVGRHHRDRSHHLDAEPSEKISKKKLDARQLSIMARKALLLARSPRNVPSS
jgi:hypothetical protein